MFARVTVTPVLIVTLSNSCEVVALVSSVLTVPLWGKFVLSSLVSLAVLTFGSHNQPAPASEVGGHSYENATQLAENPYEAVREVYQGIAEAARQGGWVRPGPRKGDLGTSGCASAFSEVT